MTWGFPGAARTYEAPSRPASTRKPGKTSNALDRRRQRACFIVRDHNGQGLAYVYYKNEPGGRLPFCSRAMRPGALK